MHIIQKAWAKLLQEIKGPRGGLYLVLGGFLVATFGCIGIGIGSEIVQNSAEGSTGSFLAAVVLLIASLMLFTGVILAILGAITGGIMAVIRNWKARAQGIPSNPSLYPSNNLSSVAPANNESQSIIAQPVTPHSLSIEQRREILQREINKYLVQGYRVISQTDTTAQLVKPKEFSCFWFLINALLLIGWIFYLLWYWSKRDRQVYIEVDVNGNIRTRR